MTLTNQHLPQPVAAENPRRAVSQRSQTSRTERGLRGALSANAAMSVLLGTVIAIAPERVEDLLGTGRPGWVRIVGLAVVLFGLDCAWVSRRQRSQLMAFTPGIIAADLSWVALSVVTLLLGWFSGGGAAAVIAVAVVVDTFATLQFLSWRELRRTR